MRIAIIGGGAIGLLFGYYFAKAGMDLRFYVRRKNQADALNESGLELVSENRLYTVGVEAEVLGETSTIDTGLVVIAVKQYHLHELKSTIYEKISIDSKLLFLQNGMSHVHLMDALPHPEVFAGIVEHGALKLKDNQVAHTGIGTTRLAAFRGSLDSIDQLLDKLANEAFAFEYQKDWYEMMAAKLLVNAVINPLTALYRVENGELAAREGFAKNMRRLFDEAIGTLRLENETLHWENVLRVCRKTASNRSSMLRDIEQGRLTEIDAISGYLLRKAEEKNASLPFTQFVYDSVRGMTGNE